ncbi:MAG TPA: methyltransferase [Pseudohaliea sp.]|nr:methyltransferase [Pseudohaliea sp.]
MKLLLPLLVALVILPAQAAPDYAAALAGDHRSDENRARDGWRHPQETLSFFGLEPTMTVVELSPGGGWYTEVLAPLLKDEGTFFAAHFDVNGSAYGRRSLGGFLRKLGADNDSYGAVTVSTLAPPATIDIAPAGSADLVLAFRNVHSWLRGDSLEAVFAAAFEALKAGGTFGIVQHRAPEGRSIDAMKSSGYVTEALVIAAAEAAGFELAGRSQINANSKDTADHPEGVWTLPPTLALGDEDRARYEAIGESDRMTLKFVKPAS